MSNNIKREINNWTYTNKTLAHTYRNPEQRVEALFMRNKVQNSCIMYKMRYGIQYKGSLPSRPIDKAWVLPTHQAKSFKHINMGWFRHDGMLSTYLSAPAFANINLFYSLAFTLSKKKKGSRWKQLNLIENNSKEDLFHKPQNCSEMFE